MRLIALLLCLALPAAAGEAPLKSLETGYDSRGWEGVGKLLIGDRGFCTGALIRPDIVLTAAHCLFERATPDEVESGSLEFLAGWRNGHAEARRTIRRTIVHPGYDVSRTDVVPRVSHDVALLQLDAPIRLATVEPFPVAHVPPVGGKVGVVSYARGREEAPSLEEVCDLLDRRGGALVLSCSVDFGASGAPVFVDLGGRVGVVSVISAKAELDGRKVALAADLEAPLRDLLGRIETGAARIRTPAGGGMVLSDRSGGAKFVRP